MTERKGSDATMPPIGLKPEWIWRTERGQELCEAIQRYLAAGEKPLPEWLDELAAHLRYLWTREPGK